MKLSEVIGKKLTDAYVKTKFRVNGLDQSEVYLEIDNGTIIKFPWNFEDISLRTKKSWRSKSLKRTEYFRELRNSVIVDFLIFDDPGSSGFFELDNGKIIYEVTMFPSGAMATGLQFYTSADELKTEFEQDFIRYSDYSS